MATAIVHILGWDKLLSLLLIVFDIGVMLTLKLGARLVIGTTGAVGALV